MAERSGICGYITPSRPYCAMSASAWGQRGDSRTGRQSFRLLELSQQQLQIARNADATKRLTLGARMNFTRHRSSSVGVICRGPDSSAKVRPISAGRWSSTRRTSPRCAIAASPSRSLPRPGVSDGTFVEDTAIVTGAARCSRSGAPAGRARFAAWRVSAAILWAVRRIEAPARSTAATSAKPTDISSSEFRPVPTSTAPNSWQGFWRGSDTPRASWTSGNPALLHLKSGIAYLGEAAGWRTRAAERIFSRRPGSISAISFWRRPPKPMRQLRTDQRCDIRGGRLPLMSAALESAARVLALDVSEFRKMDGGLSCLSLRF